MKMNTSQAMALTFWGILHASVLFAPVQAAPPVSPAASAAASRGPVEVTLTAFKVVMQGEKETLQSAEKMKPGEIIEYQAKYANSSTRTVRNLAATLPIPASLELLPVTASPAGALASTDGKTFAPQPLKRITKMANGGTKVEFVPAVEYRFLRWNAGDLGAGQTVTVSARARVLGPTKNNSSTTSATANGAAPTAVKGGAR